MTHIESQTSNPRQQAWELFEGGRSKAQIARDLGFTPTTIGRWIGRAQKDGVESLVVSRQADRGRPRLSPDDLASLHDILQKAPSEYGINARTWTHTSIADVIDRIYQVSYHPQTIPRVLERMESVRIRNGQLTPYAENDHVTLFQGEAARVLSLLPSASVDCIVTSPPYYGQRDYGVPDQLGLELHPQDYIDRLVAIFSEAVRVLKPTGSLWVNIGDTYWSGKGRPHGPDPKQKHRRFFRPQDRTGPRPLCTPKQLLLIPHRFAIAMQATGWVVRNDNVWSKVNPTPDPVDDRCAAAHEYMFHFVLGRRYYFDYEAVAVPSSGESGKKAPPSVWSIPIAPSFKKHCAVFPEELVRLPILATLPPGGVLLDPFCGSGTALSFAVAQIPMVRTIGIDISSGALSEATDLLIGRDATRA